MSQAWKQQFPEELLHELQDPRVTLPAFGKLVDQETGKVTGYDPDRIAPTLQNTLLAFAGEPPRLPSGHKKWLAVLSSRQTGKSLTAAWCAYVGTAYHPGSYSAVIADNKDRAEDLFRNITMLHEHLPEEVQMPTIPNRESRQLTFMHGAKIRTLSAESNMVGIGRAVDNLHMSELPFWANAAEAWNGIMPAFINRKEATVLMESTPAPLTQPSAEWYRDVCAEARKGIGRWAFAFVPFYQSRLNERAWPKGSPLTSEEQRLLNKYGPHHGENHSCPGAMYLTLENLAFRREVLDMDPEVRRHPQLFNVYYPSDPVSCWVQAGGAAIPDHALDKHRNSILVPWGTGTQYKEYLDPKPRAQYIIGADPAGWMGGDQAAFQVLEIWEDRWEEAAVFSSNEVDPIAFAAKLVQVARRYNDATVIIENNGAGMGAVAMLTQAYRNGDLKNLWFNARGVQAKPGIPASSQRINEALGRLIDALMDRLVLHDEETVDQLGSYRNDKIVQDGEAKNILMPGKVGKGRRPKHHWDRCSALLWAVYGAYDLPTRIRPQGVREGHGESFPKTTSEMSATQWFAHVEQVKTDKRKVEAEKRKGKRKHKVRMGRRKPKTPHWTTGR